jgi:hypothetical protein
MTCDDTGALPGGGPGASDMWWRQSLPAQGTGLVPWDMWRHRSRFLSGGMPGATGHVAMTELSGTESGFGPWGHATALEPSPECGIWHRGTGSSLQGTDRALSLAVAALESLRSAYASSDESFRLSGFSYFFLCLSELSF